MKYIVFVIVLMISCKENKKNKENCINVDLGNKITICNWGVEQIENSDIKLFVYDSLFIKKLDFLIVEKVLVFDQESLSDYKKMTIYVNENLFSDYNYRLIINDSINYDISNVEFYKKVVKIGMREKNECLVKSVKINNSTVKPPNRGVEISFNRD